MSYLDRELNITSDGEYTRYSKEIDAFLKHEKFEWEEGCNGCKPKFERVVSGQGPAAYVVWIEVYKDYIYCNGEYNCGGTISDPTFRFKKGDFNSFFAAYKEAVAFVKDFLA